MSVSVFELFRVGIGPSSSHTVGPMLAANRFIAQLRQDAQLTSVQRIQVELFGSLSSTGKGHATDEAVIAGLAGLVPNQVLRAEIDQLLIKLEAQALLRLQGLHEVPFVRSNDIVFNDQPLPEHANALSVTAFDKTSAVLASNTYFSIGGGFILDREQWYQAQSNLSSQSSTASASELPEVPYPFETAEQLLLLCEQYELNISQLVRANERASQNDQAIDQGLDRLWQAMQDCIAQGIGQRGILPGGLGVNRRAADLYQNLQQEAAPNLIASSLSGMDWLNLYALAVNEENAAGGRVVTAPTNGAAGVIPAVMAWYARFATQVQPEDFRDFLLAAGAVGMLCKQGASISGAEVGCQGEVGSACAMAAAGLAQVMGGTPEQVEHAAEIALEHHLGMTCDPVAGLVQVPCIERNAIAAVKAVNSAQMALRETSGHLVSLDKVIRTMRDTGHDMQAKYKETSQGGLAVNVIEC